jgi:Tfp pilus assembly PilM family ATPase
MRIRRAGPIGLDIGEFAVRAVQLDGTHGGSSRALLASAAIPRAPGGAAGVLSIEEARRLVRVLTRQGFVGADVVVAAPGSRVHQHALELPPRSSNAPLARIARAELQRQTQMNLGAGEMAMWDMPSPARAGEHCYAMGVALSHEHAEELIAPLEHAGLCVRAIDVAGAALVRAVADLMDDRSAATVHGAVVDLGHSGGTIHVVVGGALVYSRQMNELGLGAALIAACKASGVNLSEASDGLMRGVPGVELPASACARVVGVLYEELAVSLEYAAAQYGLNGPARVVLVGGGTAQRELHDFARSRVAELAEVQALSAHGLGADWALALGLASHPLDAGRRRAGREPEQAATNTDPELAVSASGQTARDESEESRS